MSILLRLLTACLLLVPLAGHAQWFSSSSNQGEFLPVMEAFQPSAWHDGEMLFIGMEITDEHYLYRHQFNLESLTPEVALGEPELPEGSFMNDEFMGDVYVYRDQVVFATPFEAAHAGPLDIELTFQGCADAGLCYPLETTRLQPGQNEPPAAFAGVAWSIENTSAPAGEMPSSVEQVGTPTSTFDAGQNTDRRFFDVMSQASLPLALGLFFIAGIGLTFTPCVLPMIPILSSIIVGQRPTRRRAFVLSSSYVLGMSSTYAVAGVLMGLFGAGLNLQARLQSAPVLITFAVLFTLFALAMFGAFNLQISPRLAAKVDAWQARAQRSGPGGLAVAGALSVLVVSPCVTAPLAGALVFISSTGDAVMGGTALFALGLGMGLPLLLVGTYGMTLLPRSGAWMNGVKIAFGLILLGVAIWMVERLVPAPLVLVLWAALAIGTALTLGALRFDRRPLGWASASQALGIVLLVWGVVLVIGAAQGGHNPLRPLQGTGLAAGGAGGTALEAPAFREVASDSGLQEALEMAQAQEMPAFVHFTADWCISCKRMERDVYPAPEVASLLGDYALISVDVTHNNDTTREVLDQYGLFGPPSLLFFDQGPEVVEARIQGEVNARQLGEHLQEFERWRLGS